MRPNHSSSQWASQSVTYSLPLVSSCFLPTGESHQQKDSLHQCAVSFDWRVSRNHCSRVASSLFSFLVHAKYYKPMWLGTWDECGMHRSLSRENNLETAAVWRWPFQLASSSAVYTQHFNNSSWVISLGSFAVSTKPPDEPVLWFVMNTLTEEKRGRQKRRWSLPESRRRCREKTHGIQECHSVINMAKSERWKRTGWQGKWNSPVSGKKMCQVNWKWHSWENRCHWNIRNIFAYLWSFTEWVASRSKHVESEWKMKYFAGEARRKEERRGKERVKRVSSTAARG